jgi:hypothetical protein
MIRIKVQESSPPCGVGLNSKNLVAFFIREHDKGIGNHQAVLIANNYGQGSPTVPRGSYGYRFAALRLSTQERDTAGERGAHEN